MCSSDYTLAKREAAGIYLGLNWNFGLKISALFVDLGIFGTTAYCRTRGEEGSVSLQLRSFASAADYPDHPVVRAVVPAVGSPDEETNYVVAGISGGAAYYDWVEVDSRGRESWSDPFAPGQMPSTWSSEYAVVHRPTSTGSEADRIVTPVTPDPDVQGNGQSPMADIVVYAKDAAIAAPIVSQIQQDRPGDVVRLLVAPDSLPQTCTNLLAGILNVNATWNRYHSAPMYHQYPVSPGPEVYVVGEMIGGVRPAAFVSTGDPAGPLTLRSDYLLYDTDGDGMPDGPISRIPALTLEEAQRSAQYAHEYNSGQWRDSGNHLITLVGDRLNGVLVNRSRAVLDSVAILYQGLGHALRSQLRVSDFSPIDLGPRRQAFEQAVEGGVDEIWGYGGNTNNGYITGKFTECTSSTLDRRQRVLLWMPGCYVHETWDFLTGRRSDFCWSPPHRSVVEEFMFGDPTKTTVASSVADMDPGYDFAHMAFARALAAERVRHATLCDNASVARIAYDAVLRLAGEPTAIREHAICQSAWGSLVCPSGVQAMAPPVAVNDLNADVVADNQVWLSWTAPSVGGVGRGVEYDLRCSQWPFNDNTFAIAPRVYGMPVPGYGGTSASYGVTGLAPHTTYWFAIKTRDATGAWSSMSNILSATTIGGGGGGGTESARPSIEPRFREVGSVTDRERSAHATASSAVYAQDKVTERGLNGDGLRSESVRAPIAQRGLISPQGGVLAAEMMSGRGGPTWSIYFLNPEEAARVEGSDGAGLVFQSHGNQTWSDRTRINPGASSWQFGIREFMRPGRIVFLGAYSLFEAWNAVESFANGEAQILKVIGARHSRLGDLTPLIEATGTYDMGMSPGDTLTIAYGPSNDSTAAVRDWFFLVGPAGSFASTEGSKHAGLGERPSRPVQFVLRQNRPNPFSGTTEISFDLPIDVPVLLEVFDAQGRLVRTLAKSRFAAGAHTVLWDNRADDGHGLGAGVYLYRIQAGGFRDQKKMVLLAD